MMSIKKICFIRHGMTAGNREKRYIGRTDEPLCAEGLAQLRSGVYPLCDAVIASPMLRCRQTAECLYPNVPLYVYDELRECDFGDFEGKNYVELSGDPDYAAWMASNGTLPFPHGESHEAFRERSVKAFQLSIQEYSFDTVAFVVHGGTIMSILSELALPRLSFYDYQVKNGQGFMTEWNGNRLTVTGRIG